MSVLHIRTGPLLFPGAAPKPGRDYAARANSTNALLSFAFTLVVRYVGTIPEFSSHLIQHLSILFRPHQLHTADLTCQFRSAFFDQRRRNNDV